MSFKVNADLCDFGDTDIGGNPICLYQGQRFTGIVEFYDNGILEAEQEYKNGLEEGFDREYWSNGQLKSELFLYRNMVVGDLKKWDENGNLITHQIFKDGQHFQTVI